MALTNSADDNRLMPNRREIKKQEKLRRIKRAAEKLFNQYGFEKATMRAIATEADVAMGTLYLYAEDKLELLFLLYGKSIQQIQDEVFLSASVSGELIDSLESIFYPYFDYYEKNPTLSQIFLKEAMTQKAKNREDLGNMTLGFIAKLTELIQQHQKHGDLRSNFVALNAASSIFSLYFFMCQSWLGGYIPDRASLNVAFHEALSLQLQGLKN